MYNQYLIVINDYWVSSLSILLELITHIKQLIHHIVQIVYQRLPILVQIINWDIPVQNQAPSGLVQCPLDLLVQYPELLDTYISESFLQIPSQLSFTLLAMQDIQSLVQLWMILKRLFQRRVLQSQLNWVWRSSSQQIQVWCLSRTYLKATMDSWKQALEIDLIATMSGQEAYLRPFLLARSCPISSLAPIMILHRTMYLKAVTALMSSEATKDSKASKKQEQALLKFLSWQQMIPDVMSISAMRRGWQYTWLEAALQAVREALALAKFLILQLIFASTKQSSTRRCLSSAFLTSDKIGSMMLRASSVFPVLSIKLANLSSILCFKYVLFWSSHHLIKQ